MRKDGSGKEGNAAIVIVVLLLLGGAAYFFLFREVKEPDLPDTNALPPAADAEAPAADTAANGVRPLEEAGPDTPAQGFTGGALPMTADGAVDWDVRRDQLKEKYSDEFSEPQVGSDIRVLLRSGRTVEGRITDLAKEFVTIRITGTGKATYQRAQLSPASQLVLFKDVYVNYSVEKDLAAEKAARAAEAAATPQ